MTTKNPFELRADILQLAKDYMDQQMHMNIAFWEKMVEANKANLEDMQKAYTPYSMEDLMKKAHEMYSFVSKKD